MYEMHISTGDRENDNDMEKVFDRPVRKKHWWSQKMEKSRRSRNLDRECTPVRQNNRTALVMILWLVLVHTYDYHSANFCRLQPASMCLMQILLPIYPLHYLSAFTLLYITDSRTTPGLFVEHEESAPLVRFVSSSFLICPFHPFQDLPDRDRHIHHRLALEQSVHAFWWKFYGL